MEIPRHPFTTREAYTAGLTARMLRGPRVDRVIRGAYVKAGAEQSLAVRVAAVLRTLPGPLVADSTTALQLVGVDVGDPAILRLATTAAHVTRRPGIQTRRLRVLPPTSKGVVQPLWALVSARHELNLVELVTAGDWLIRLRLATIDQVRTALGSATGRHCGTARRAGDLVRERVESPRESVLRLLVVLAGLPEPECNVELGTETFFIARVDLLLRSWKIVLEYEGDQHRTDPRQYDKDLGRHELLAEQGYFSIRVSKVAMRRPETVLDRVYRALCDRGYTGPPPQLTAEWRAAFDPLGRLRDSYRWSRGGFRS